LLNTHIETVITENHVFVHISVRCYSVVSRPWLYVTWNGVKKL